MREITWRQQLGTDWNGEIVELMSVENMPNVFAVTVSYVEHQFERSIQIAWKIRRTLLGDVFANLPGAVA